MSYSVAPYLLSIDDLKKAIGSKDKALTLALVRKREEAFDENELNHLVPKDEEEDDWEEWNAIAASKVLIDGDLDNENMHGSEYGYALEALCEHMGEQESIESLESVRSGYSSEYDGYWPWLFGNDKPLIPFSGYNDGDFPVIGYLTLADIPAEIQRTKELNFGEKTKKNADVEASIRNKAQLRMELAVFSSDYETVAVFPADFPWLDESYYNSVQKELESLGFRKIRDGEMLHLSRVFPETRHFFRSFVNAEGDICATVSQIRIVEPQNDEQKNINVRCIEFSSEFSNGTFFITTNTLGVHELENIEGIIFENFLPDDPVKELLYYHNKSRTTLQQYVIKSELRKNATLDDLIEAGKRQQAFLRADRQKKVDAPYAGVVVTDEGPDEDLMEWLEEIRSDMLALYEKALEAKKDIVTFYY